MKKLWRSRKALSPVIAAIILIAVTVAVSIAVAAWMGAITFTFMGSEELKVKTHTWESADPPTYIDLTVTNTGATTLTLDDAQVNNAAPSVSHNATGTLTAGATTVVRIQHAFAAGIKYNFAVLTLAGNKYLYTASAPS
ncbi:MAG: hypothetical protein JSV85_05340 [Candidatus Bathyarchaeota archaeon]|nr:MAG: hypothetical protein JSV85_05340 [Candidatus Bathyarchaeota archaeon]